MQNPDLGLSFSFKQLEAWGVRVGVANMEGASGEVFCEDIKMAGVGGGGLGDVGMSYRGTWIWGGYLRIQSVTQEPKGKDQSMSRIQRGLGKGRTQGC